MKKYFSALLIIVLFTNSSCKKDSPAEEQLLPETHTGAYTFGCKVDGKIYTDSGKGGLLSTQHVNYNFIGSDSSINVFAGNIDSKFSFTFSIKYSGNVGIYLARTYPYMASFSDNSNGTVPNGTNTFETNDINIGRVNIKYFFGSASPMNGVSGTFEIDAANAAGKVIHITEGRFDIGF